MVTWSCLDFLFAQLPTSIFLAWSLTAGSPSKTMCAVLSLVSLKELVFWGWWSVSLWTPLCYFVVTMLLNSSPNLWVLFNGVGCRLWNFHLHRSPAPGVFGGRASHKLSCRCVINIMLLHCVCCTRLILTRIIVYSVRYYLPLSEFDIPELRLQLIH